MSSPSPRRLLALGAKLLLSLAITAGLLEVALHLAPELLPASYLRRYPLHGAAFFDRDLLDRTPIGTLPLPLRLASYRGPPPRDLVRIGLAPESEIADRREYPEIHLPIDALGLPNDAILERAGIVIVGDSLAMWTGVSRPRGLQAILAEERDEPVYNLGVAATGPYPQLWLLEHQGLVKRPEVVLWFFFGGNDPIDAALTLHHQERGALTWGAVHAGRRPPLLRLPSLARFLVGSRRARRGIEPLPGLEVVGSASRGRRVWMLPGYLQALARTREQWGEDPGWIGSMEVLRDARDLVGNAGARLLVVYLPSKPQVLLPHLVPDAELLHRMACFERADAVTATPEVFLADALRHRGDLEALMVEFCAAEGIEFLSATGVLEALVEEGERAFFDTDTHWTPRGQAALAAELLERL
jgi:hypothetical protein